jgi:hypothetical protein
MIKLRVSFWIAVFRCCGSRFVKNPFTTKPFPKGFITGNKAINDDEKMMSRLLNDIVLNFIDTLFNIRIYVKHKWNLIVLIAK